MAKEDDRAAAMKALAGLSGQRGDESVNMLTNQQVSQDVNLSASQQVARPVAHPDEASLKRFTTYLPPSLIKSLKVHAAQQEREIYEVVRAAIEQYIKA